MPSLLLFLALTTLGIFPTLDMVQPDPTLERPYWCEKGSFGATDLDKEICGW